MNRLDQIVVFHPLQPDEIAKVADIAVTRLAERRGLTQAGVLLDISPAAVAQLAEGGFSPELGARALRRHLDTVLVAPAARLLARAGAEGHGGTLTVRAPSEELGRPLGSRLGVHEGEVHVSLWRRAASTGRRMVRSALALGELRRLTDRELDLPAATSVQHKIGEIESTLATAARKKDGKTALPGRELARLSAEHARLTELWQACTRAQAELRTAEELCLEALARDVDAVDLIDAAVQQRYTFRRDLFWLLTALRPQRPGIVMLAHTPDARPALQAWLNTIAGAAAEHRWRFNVHTYFNFDPNWKHLWGPPHERSWIDKSFLASGVTAVLVRVGGPGAESLMGLEAGMHRFVGLAGDPCHVHVDLIYPKFDMTDEEWTKLPTPPTPVTPRGAPMREVTVGADRVDVHEEETEVPWSELPRRLDEAAAARMLIMLEHAGHGCADDKLGEMWMYPATKAEGEP